MSKYNRTGNVHLTSHAAQRIKERLPGARVGHVRNVLRQRLKVELRAGIKPDCDGLLWVELRPGIWATCAPSLEGGYVVITIIVEEESQNEQEA